MLLKKTNSIDERKHIGTISFISNLSGTSKDIKIYEPFWESKPLPINFDCIKHLISIGYVSFDYDSVEYKENNP